MGAGIQPNTDQSSGNPFLDVVNVLFEPGAVFERVRNRPNFLAPFLSIIAVQCVLFFVNLSYMKVGVAAQAAAAGRPAPGTGVLAAFGLIGLIVVLAIIFVVSALILWMLTSILGGGEAKFSTMLSVAAYSAVPSAILLSIVGTIVVHLRGVAQITSPQDLQPALGLDLLMPGSKGFVGGILKGINPFSIWGLVLMAIGVSTTQRTSKGNGYVAAGVTFVILLLIGAALSAAFGG